MVQSRWRVWLGVVGVAFLVAGCGSRAGREAADAPGPSHAKTGKAPMAIPAGEIETLTLTAHLPKEAPRPTGGKENCPKGMLQAALGIELANPHGIVIGKVEPNGAGAKAGLKPGDSVVGCNGHPAACPSSLEPNLYSGDTPGQAMLTVERSKPASHPKTHAKAATKPAAK
jgi:S1-C subfamily serine protease